MPPFKTADGMVAVVGPCRCPRFRTTFVERLARGVWLASSPGLHETSIMFEKVDGVERGVREVSPLPERFHVCEM